MDGWMGLMGWMGWTSERTTAVPITARSHLQPLDWGDAYKGSCHVSKLHIRVTIGVCALQPLMSTFCPTYCDAQIYWKMVGLLCLPWCKSFFSQQRVLHVKPKSPPVIRHTDLDHGGKDVDVNMGERHSIGREETDEPERCIEGNQRPTCATREAVASVSTSVPHGGADPVHFRNQIPESQCN